MKLNRTIRLLTLACMALLIAVPTAMAHDMWLQKSGNGYMMGYGHSGKTEAYDPAKKAIGFEGYTGNGWKVPIQMVHEKDHARFAVQDDLYLITAAFDNLYWYDTEDGWKNFDEPQEMKGKIAEEGHAIKFTKHIVKWADYMSKPIGQRAEIVPLKDPTKLKEGDMLPIMIYLEGQPLPTKESKLALTSDFSIDHPTMVPLEKAGGPVMIKIGPPGTQLISVKHEHNYEGIKNVFFAFTLTFETTK